MQDQLDTKEEFSVVKRAKSFVHAWRGIRILIKTTHNAWIEIGIVILAVILGFYFSISNLEWLVLTLASGLVLAAEAFNTAIEVDMDLTSPEYHPYARDTKDLAAGAVLISATAGLIIGVLIFARHIF